MGSYKPFTLETEQSFGTMRFNEFLSDRFIGLFIKQDFGKLLFKAQGQISARNCPGAQYGNRRAEGSRHIMRILSIKQWKRDILKAAC